MWSVITSVRFDHAIWRVQVRQLVDGADAIGTVLVYRHQGFLPNKRQLRMGGLATLEMAQTLRHLVGLHHPQVGTRVGGGGQLGVVGMAKLGDDFDASCISTHAYQPCPLPWASDSKGSLCGAPSGQPLWAASIA